MVKSWLRSFGASLDAPVPDAYQIWQQAQKFLADGDQDNATRCQRMNYILHNSHIPNEVNLGQEVRFGYGGVGVILHETCDIGRGVVIGANVTLGGKTGGARRVAQDGKIKIAPLIEDYVYIGTGAKVLGGVTIGAMSIIGANAVVTSDIPPLSVAAGIPAKVLSQITPENVLLKRPTYLAARHFSSEDFVAMVRYYSRDKSLDYVTDWSRPSPTHSRMLRRKLVRCPEIPGAPISLDMNGDFKWSSVVDLPQDLQAWLHSQIALRALLNHGSRAFYDVALAASLMLTWYEQNSRTSSATPAIAWDLNVAAIRVKHVGALWHLGYKTDWMEALVKDHVEVLGGAGTQTSKLAPLS
ncbi:serine acetyltransferase [Ensifer adhaerens]|uniref:serine acetyltransferase n=1 Tax=Ensifer adhaerens TaxID=106592 RepID=UPI00384A6040